MTFFSQSAIRCGPGRPFGQDCGQKPHCVGALGIADRFNVSVFVNINAGADSYAL